MRKGLIEKTAQQRFDQTDSILMGWQGGSSPAARREEENVDDSRFTV